MACSTCGKNTRKNVPVDRRGNKLSKYAYLKPNQLSLRDAQAQKDKEKK